MPGTARRDDQHRMATARQAVARTARALGAGGLAGGTGGNVSIRQGDLVAVTPSGAELGTLEAADVVVVDLAGRIVDGRLAPTSELALHLGAMRREGARAVAHLHPPIATALACVVDEVPCLVSEMLALGGSIRVAPYRTFGTEELADVTLEALRGRRAVLMANHGALVVGADGEELVRQAIRLEFVCELYWRAAQIGTPRVLDEDRQAEHLAAARRLGYGGLRPLEP